MLSPLMLLIAWFGLGFSVELTFRKMDLASRGLFFILFSIVTCMLEIQNLRSGLFLKVVLAGTPFHSCLLLSRYSKSETMDSRG